MVSKYIDFKLPARGAGSLLFRNTRKLTPPAAAGRVFPGNFAQRPAALALFLAGLFCLAAVAPLKAGNVTIKPVQVCDDEGDDCANSGQQLYLAADNKIWAQAGITINFLPWASIDNTSLQTINTNGDLTSLFGDASASAVPNYITMWFVTTINNCGGEAAYGCASGNKIAIDDDTFAGGGRMDTIAHEIGHSLGLDHYGDASKNDYLMNAGGTRTIPTALSDITPDGAGLDKLTAGQITTAQASPDNTPEPATVFTLFAGLSMVAGLRRKAA